MNESIVENVPSPSNEFIIEIDQQQFLVEINKITGGNTFLFCRPLFGTPTYFFMERNEKGKWVLSSRFTVLSHVLALEKVLSEKITRVMRLISYS